MNPDLLQPNVQAYLNKHLETPIEKFVFKGSPFDTITIQELAQQLDGRRRMKHKLPLWHSTEGILFPPKINLEQTSSETTARYKASLIEGTTLADLTGGFGIDSYYFAQQVDQVTHIEMNEEVSAFAKANFKTLNALNIECIVGDSINYLQGNEVFFDTIFVDPGRRTDAKGKVFMLADCLPNVPENLDVLVSKCNTLWIKTAPLLDITAGLKELKNVSEIHIVAVKNEVKELLWKMSNTQSDDVLITTINHTPSGVDVVTVPQTDLYTAFAAYTDPLEYLYEPNAAIMKAGAFAWISNHYGIDKLHQHTHLYSSNMLLNFPGRRFKIEKVLPFDKKLKKTLKIDKANITTRNFSMTVSELRKKLSIKDGGSTYLFFTTTQHNTPIVIVCHKA